MMQNSVTAYVCKKGDRFGDGTERCDMFRMKATGQIELRSRPVVSRVVIGRGFEGLQSVVPIEDREGRASFDIDEAIVDFAALATLRGTAVEDAVRAFVQIHGEVLPNHFDVLEHYRRLDWLEPYVAAGPNPESPLPEIVQRALLAQERALEEELGDRTVLLGAAGLDWVSRRHMEHTHPLALWRFEARQIHIMMMANKSVRGPQDQNDTGGRLRLLSDGLSAIYGDQWDSNPYVEVLFRRHLRALAAPGSGEHLSRKSVPDTASVWSAVILEWLAETSTRYRHFVHRTVELDYSQEWREDNTMAVSARLIEAQESSSLLGVMHARLQADIIKETPFHECVECRSWFRPARPDRVFCSPKCRNTFGTRRRRAKAREE